MDINLLIVFIYSYLLGSIPFGLIITKIFLKEDIRKIGSGNIGATNVLRTGKKSLATFTLLLDVSKGFISIYVTKEFFNDLTFFSGLICLIGHIFPVWLKFKGGKGVATYLGIILALSFELAIIFCFTWLIVIFIFRYSSVSSIISSLIVFLSSIIFQNLNLNIFLLVLFVIIIYAHKDNIIRIKNKTENKINF